MSRRPPSDHFTRFTSTAPQASSSRFSPSGATQTSSSTPSKPNQSASQPTSSSSSPQSNAPTNETPAQRVARLRAAHRQTNIQNQLSPVDRLISRGRTFADIAHRLTTYSLLAITGVSTVIAAYGLVSLVSHNRRQKRAWIEREMDRLAEAQRAFLRGEATAEQLHLLEQERAGEEIARKFKEDKARRKEEGTWARLSGTFGNVFGKGDMGVESPGGQGDLMKKRDEMRGLGELVEQAALEQQAGNKQTIADQQARFEGSDNLKPVAVSAGPVAGVGLDEKGRPVPINKVQRVSRAQQGEQVDMAASQRTPGQLDVWADNAASKASSTGSGWWSWISGTSKSAPSTSTSS